MDQRFILLPRASSSYQLRGIRHHPKSIPRTTHNSVHRQRNNMALGVLALHHPCRGISDSGLVPGRDTIRPQHPKLGESPTGLSCSAHARHRAGKVPQDPEGSGEVGAWVTASRNWSGFMATYIQIEWVTGAGPAVAFEFQAGITAASIILIVFLQVYGKRLRRAQGRMVFGSRK